MSLNKIDSQIAKAIEAETERQRDNLVMIASENYTSQVVMDIQGSILTNKYAEGYPGGQHPSPFPFADFVTATTHKTLRGPRERGGLILAKKKYEKKLMPKSFQGYRVVPLCMLLVPRP